MQTPDSEFSQAELDSLLVERGEDHERFRPLVVRYAHSSDFNEAKIREKFGTNYRTLLGLRRLAETLRVGQVRAQTSEEQVDHHFLTFMLFLKTYARRVDASDVHVDKPHPATTTKWNQRFLKLFSKNILAVRPPKPIIGPNC